MKLAGMKLAGMKLAGMKLAARHEISRQEISRQEISRYFGTPTMVDYFMELLEYYWTLGVLRRSVAPCTFGTFGADVSFNLNPACGTFASSDELWFTFDDVSLMSLALIEHL